MLGGVYMEIIVVLLTFFIIILTMEVWELEKKVDELESVKKDETKIQRKM